jgi:hypothetical protein
MFLFPKEFHVIVFFSSFFLFVVCRNTQIGTGGW